MPARRVELFEQAFEAFYQQREAFWDTAGLTPLRLRRALGAVANRLHEQSLSGLAEEGEVTAALRQVLPDPEQVATVLQAANEVSGFLVSRGEGVYGFLHRSLQEYFAALYLVDNPQAMPARLAQPVIFWWR